MLLLLLLVGKGGKLASEQGNRELFVALVEWLSSDNWRQSPAKWWGARWAPPLRPSPNPNSNTHSSARRQVSGGGFCYGVFCCFPARRLDTLRLAAAVWGRTGREGSSWDIWKLRAAAADGPVSLLITISNIIMARRLRLLSWAHQFSQPPPPADGEPRSVRFRRACSRRISESGLGLGLARRRAGRREAKGKWKGLNLNWSDNGGGGDASGPTSQLSSEPAQLTLSWDFIRSSFERTRPISSSKFDRRLRQSSQKRRMIARTEPRVFSSCLSEHRARQCVAWCVYAGDATAATAAAFSSDWGLPCVWRRNKYNKSNKKGTNERTRMAAIIKQARTSCWPHTNSSGNS